jgi:hypothetical protein
VEQKIAGIERLAREILTQTQDLRTELGTGESADNMWARMIREVLTEIDKRGAPSECPKVSDDPSRPTGFVGGTRGLDL